MLPITTDALVIGAGPIGLFQVFELGLLEMRSHVVDSLPFIGGQCVELYADKPIYDIPGLPIVTGRALVERLQQQTVPFAPEFHLDQQVDIVQPTDDGRFDVTTSVGTRFSAKVVIVAAGAGSFQPRAMKVDGLERFHHLQVFFRLPAAKVLAGKRVLIAGNGHDAVERALTMAERVGALAPSHITLMHRRDDFIADDASLARLADARASGRVRFIAAQPNAIDSNDGLLTGLVVTRSDDGGLETLPLDAIVVSLGISPKLGPIADWGVGIERKQVVVDTERFETSTRGLFAVGDIVSYPGKRKLIVSGFHEATLAAFAAAARVYPDRAQPLQYTTTSPKLHRLLGVSSGDDASD